MKKILIGLLALCTFSALSYDSIEGDLIATIRTDDYNSFSGLSQSLELRRVNNLYRYVHCSGITTWNCKTISRDISKDEIDEVFSQKKKEIKKMYKSLQEINNFPVSKFFWKRGESFSIGELDGLDMEHNEYIGVLVVPPWTPLFVAIAGVPVVLDLAFMPVTIAKHIGRGHRARNLVKDLIQYNEKILSTEVITQEKPTLLLMDDQFEAIKLIVEKI